MSSQAYRLHQNGDMSRGASMCGCRHPDYTGQVCEQKSASSISDEDFWHFLQFKLNTGQAGMIIYEELKLQGKAEGS